MQRGRGLPLVAKLGLIALILALGGIALYLAAGGLRFAVGALGSTLSGFVDNVTSSPSPTPSTVPIADAPLLEQPDEPYTKSTTVDLVVTVPSRIVGSPDYRIRVYLGLDDQTPAVIKEATISDGPRTIIPVELAKGINNFSVTILGPSGESDTSPVVRYVLDTTKPKVTITSPKDGGTVNAKKVTIKGKVQARSSLLAKNTDNDATASVTAEADGTFALSIALTTGLNHITITATDPAGNSSEKAYTVKRGTGKLTVSLSASDYSISRKALPEPIRLVCEVTDPDGNPLVGASITFTLSIPGIPTLTKDGVTDSKGRFSFDTTINKGAEIGQGSATVLVSTDEFGSTSDLTVITVRK